MPKQRKGARPSDRTMPRKALVLRPTTALADPIRYLEALDAAERAATSAPEPAVPPPVAQPLPVAPPAVSRASERPNRQTETWVAGLAGIQGLALGATTGTNPSVTAVPLIQRHSGPIAAVMNEICVQCADTVLTSWNVMRSTLASGDAFAAREIDALEGVMARMVLHESRTRPTKHGHTVYLERVLKGLFGEDQKDEGAIIALYLAENSGIRFNALDEFQSFHNGLSRRIGPRRGDGTSEEQYEERLLILFRRLDDHLPHLDITERSALGTANTLLLGLDLFADAKGVVPPCKCLRIAARCLHRMDRADAIRLLRLFGPDRADDLIELLETGDLPPAALEILPLYPEETARRDLRSLQSLLREWVLAGKPNGFTRFAARFAA